MKLGPTVPLTLVGAALVLAALMWLDHKSNDGDQRLVSQAIAANAAWRARIVKDKALSEANHARQAALLRNMVAAYEIANRFRDSVSRADTLPPPDTTNPVALHWYGLYTWERIRADSLDSAADQAQSVALLARADAARAWRLVEQGRAASLLADEALRQSQCRILWIRCPSRLTVGVFAFVAGAVTLAVVKR